MLISTGVPAIPTAVTAPTVSQPSKPEQPESTEKISVANLAKYRASFSGSIMYSFTDFLGFKPYLNATIIHFGEQHSSGAAKQLLLRMLVSKPDELLRKDDKRIKYCLLEEIPFELNSEIEQSMGAIVMATPPSVMDNIKTPEGYQKVMSKVFSLMPEKLAVFLGRHQELIPLLILLAQKNVLVKGFHASGNLQELINNDLQEYKESHPISPGESLESYKDRIKISYKSEAQARINKAVLPLAQKQDDYLKELLLRPELKGQNVLIWGGALHNNYATPDSGSVGIGEFLQTRNALRIDLLALEKQDTLKKMQGQSFGKREQQAYTWLYEELSRNVKDKDLQKNGRSLHYMLTPSPDKDLADYILITP